MNKAAEQTLPDIDEYFDDQEMLAAFKILMQGGTLADIKGVSARQIEGLYALGYQVYQANDFVRAESVFAALCMLDHSEKRFWLGLGSSRQQLGKYAEAAQAFGMAALQDIDDPVPPLHGGMCLMSLQDKENAANAFRQAVLVSGDRPECAAHKKQGLAMLDLLGAPLFEERPKS